MLPWPPYSRDLSPNELVWDIIGRRLHVLPQPRSKDELWQMVEREWTLYLDVLLCASPSALILLATKPTSFSLCIMTIILNKQQQQKDLYRVLYRSPSRNLGYMQEKKLAKYPCLINQVKPTTYAFWAVDPHQRGASCTSCGSHQVSVCQFPKSLPNIPSRS
ncbi:hypothetical protein LAZ67_X001808 [Cordylochernes scorpioides]|uniref:Uncharacterized protein n=1 Tax=Cordylochernes scorpioides TaxID=51811 RepID=A0ABY6LST6_9ARAC|nr:hypothetical protein LAZ67_X001808 [Cordylochernes scorpioides]